MPETKDLYERSPEVVQREALVDRIERLYDELMQRASAMHVPDFMDATVTMGQAKVLYLLMTSGPFRISELASRLGVSAPTTSQLVDRLVEQGLAARADDRSDRRQVLVTVTSAGRQQLERFRELGSHQVRLLLARVADADLPLVEQTVRLLIDALAASAGDPAPLQTVPPGDPAPPQPAPA